jgi:hypothetical protein
MKYHFSDEFQVQPVPQRFTQAQRLDLGDATAARPEGLPEYDVLVVLKKTRIPHVCSWFQTPIKDEKHGCL